MSFAKLVHNCRTSPPQYIFDELEAFDNDVKDAFTEFSQLVPDSIDWSRAQRSTGTGGIGLRSSARHAAAAFAASCVNTAPLQSNFFPALSEADVLAEAHLATAISSLPQSEAVAAWLEAGLGISQKTLSRSIDRAEADAECTQGTG